MDARIAKSKKKIFDAFMCLRAKKELHKITVKELCQEAHINKSTFYDHYEDIFDLSDKIESELVSEAISEIKNIENLILDVSEITYQLFKVFTSHYDKLEVVFSGAQRPNLIDKISKAIKEIIFTQHPELESNQKYRVLLDYSIFGGYYAYEARWKNKFDSDSVIDILTKANEQMYKLLK